MTKCSEPDAFLYMLLQKVCANRESCLRVFHRKFSLPISGKRKRDWDSFVCFIKPFTDFFINKKFLLSVSNTTKIPGGVCPESSLSGKKGTIPELGSALQQSAKRPHTESTESSVEIFNPPHTTWVYTDYQLKTDFVCVAINIFSGTKAISFDISEDGLQVIVKFAWATAMYHCAEMFADELKDGNTTTDHPMIHALSTHLVKIGMSEDAEPEGHWTVSLPCKVRREVTSYKMSKISSGTTRIFFIRFTAYQSDVIIEQAKRKMSFD